MNRTITKEDVLNANIKLHSKVAHNYNKTEPQFRPENIRIVENNIVFIKDKTNASTLLDLGCGSGFIIDIAKKYVKEITGVDLSKDMLAQVDLSGNCKIELFNHDTSELELGKTFDLATSYSFLHHLYDYKNTLEVAYKHLKPGGIYYADLEPNWFFWNAINSLDLSKTYNDIVNRELSKVRFKDEDIEMEYGISKDDYENAEYGKQITGGMNPESVERELLEAGFKKVDIIYYWFLGQAGLNNSDNPNKDLILAEVEKVMKETLPVSKAMYKYFGFIAYK